jgi:hypothetical protein
MGDSDPKYITEAEFVTSLKQWSNDAKRSMIANVNRMTEGRGKSGAYSNIKTKRTEVKLSDNISYRFIRKYGDVAGIRFAFPRQGIYIHYGVGRGYIYSGNSVDRGYKKLPKKQKATGPLKRKPVDWFDVVIKTGIGRLADIVQERYGDRAMTDLLGKETKFFISKTDKSSANTDIEFL